MSHAEKRLRLRFGTGVAAETAKLNPGMMETLGIVNEIEAIVAGKPKGKWKASATESVPPNEVWLNQEQMKALGLADNTIATVRKPLKLG